MLTHEDQATNTTEKHSHENKTEKHATRQPSALGALAVATFRRDLPELLQDKSKQGLWVAYHGDQQVGFAKNPVDLYEQCQRDHLPDEDFIVCPVQIEPPDEVDSPYPLD